MIKKDVFKTQQLVKGVKGHDLGLLNKELITSINLHSLSKLDHQLQDFVIKITHECMNSENVQ